MKLNFIAIAKERRARIAKVLADNGLDCKAGEVRLSREGICESYTDTYTFDLFDEFGLACASFTAHFYVSPYRRNATRYIIRDYPDGKERIRYGQLPSYRASVCR